jgi:hypothetical protein
VLWCPPTHHWKIWCVFNAPTTIRWSVGCVADAPMKKRDLG